MNNNLNINWLLSFFYFNYYFFIEFFIYSNRIYCVTWYLGFKKYHFRFCLPFLQKQYEFKKSHPKFLFKKIIILS